MGTYLLIFGGLGLVAAAAYAIYSFRETRRVLPSEDETLRYIGSDWLNVSSLLQNLQDKGYDVRRSELDRMLRRLQKAEHIELSGDTADQSTGELRCRRSA